MDEITVSDMLEHYRIRIAELYERTDALAVCGTDLLQVLPECWKGPAANAFADKLQTAENHFRASESELSDALNLLREITAFFQTLQIL